MRHHFLKLNSRTREKSAVFKGFCDRVFLRKKLEILSFFCHRSWFLLLSYFFVRVFRVVGTVFIVFGDGCETGLKTKSPTVYTITNWVFFVVNAHQKTHKNSQGLLNQYFCDKKRKETSQEDLPGGPRQTPSDASHSSAITDLYSFRPSPERHFHGKNPKKWRSRNQSLFRFYRQKVRSQNAPKVSKSVIPHCIPMGWCSGEGASGVPPGGLPRTLFT